ncbi:CBS domain-containing protein [Fundicoccus culcitae]|uniref:CBS domain-containing protein n=1 Tax=Fundicoccus culcitae TaxID=2969821 RepID=A0ABY5P2A3_9LACT|nr:CBS domain-containing protein [Fundicoccus culcitae]UUX32832.1 CBS domain-containing protein [Fundicoccus culcitae]
MYVKDYMSTDLITIKPTTTILQASDLMKRHDIKRLPVMENDRLVGLVTRDLIDKNLPSGATSLSAHEVNYVLEKTKVSDFMMKKIDSVAPDSLLEQAAVMMRTRDIGVVVVLDDNTLVGILTDKDIFRAFADISGYNSPGTTIVLELEKDRVGVIEEIGDALLATQINLSHMTVYHFEGVVRVVMHVETNDVTQLTNLLKQAGYQVQTVQKKTPID